MWSRFLMEIFNFEGGGGDVDNLSIWSLAASQAVEQTRFWQNSITLCVPSLCRKTQNTLKKHRKKVDTIFVFVKTKQSVLFSH